MEIILLILQIPLDGNKDPAASVWGAERESQRTSTFRMEDCETMEDVYMASVETDRGVKEQLHLYDTRGLQEGVELPKHYFSFADGFVLVYSVNNLESFQRVELLKKEIDKFKDKKEVAIVVLGNKIDLSEQRQVDAEVAQQWAKSEKPSIAETMWRDHIKNENYARRPSCSSPQLCESSQPRGNTRHVRKPSVLPPVTALESFSGNQPAQPSPAQTLDL
ncbi:NF-kappa-B inhibitor-interacting Ras-like protein 1 isoform X2 [Saimiri boliviensis]|uniref:NF-kappa-B inhibitor-interacting Ras-like protein 1 isoform X2 n=1 Tax=Saimiri boliviensis TaxID=27679 RepID=UPI003D76F4B1